MEKELIETMLNLGESGIGLAYFWIITDRLLIIALFILATWGIRAIWRNIKDNL